MKYIYSIIKADYLQRTRSYAFLITMAITIYAAYSFVPPPSAHYTTLNIVGFKGVYNSAWVGHLSAMMTTVMLSLYGFFLVTGGIKKDVDTEVGLIIATTPISNFGYLLSKMLSNFLVLLTIAGTTFVVSLAMFFLRSSGYPFVISNFIIPFLLLALPALLFISAIAVVGEVFLGKRAILQYIGFVFLFGAIMGHTQGELNDTIAVITDPFGLRTMTMSIQNQVNNEFHTHIDGVSMGFTFHKKENAFRTFTWNGITWTPVFMLSRFLWIILSFSLVYISSFFFHRFDFKQIAHKKKKATRYADTTPLVPPAITAISMSALPPILKNYSIIPLIKTEIMLLVRKGSKWFWLVNAGLCASMLFAPLSISHTYLLPVLWFLQVTRLSELATKEKTNRLHYFTWSSYKPLQRMLPAQILAGVILMVTLALPLIIRYLLVLNGFAVVNILLGAVFIVLLAVCMGIVSGGKKLYEIVFFLITYLVTQKLPLVDYLGAIAHNSQVLYTVLILNIALCCISFWARNYQARHL
ncbi:MAG: hypothetical protein WC615_17265 [Mucilaginibacter sp.]|uniref:hypothetical protein n=1 Tax=Mucilaginibacter sp. TaxID=1882438 RepID=UPI003564D9BC